LKARQSKHISVEAVVLTVRNNQLAQFEIYARHNFIEFLCQSLLDLFPEDLRDLDSGDLYRKIEQAITQASCYGLNRKSDIFRYMNLAVTCGWDFDTQPANVWMRNMLVDPAVSCPSDRLDRLIAEYIYRCELEERTRKLLADYKSKDRKQVGDLT
jgi:hypothetical protein